VRVFSTRIFKPFVRQAIAYDHLAAEIGRAPGLDGNAEPGLNKVLGKTSDPAVQARYEQQQLRRKQNLDNT
jgi:hypothetical protein